MFGRFRSSVLGAWLSWSLICWHLLAVSVPAAPVVALVRGTFTASRNGSEADGVAAYYGVVKECLTAVKIRFAELTDESVAAGKLSGYRLAILPYNSLVPRAEEQQLLRFLDGGGKLIAFYTLPPRLRERFGMQIVRHQLADPPGRFARIKFRPGPVVGLPDTVAQASWNINVIKVTSPKTRILAYWQDARGRGTGLPAWILSPCGAWMSHVLLPRATRDKQHLLLALIGHYHPEVWEHPALSALSRIARIGDCQRLDELQTIIERADLTYGARRRARKALKHARETKARAVELALDRRFADACVAAKKARQQAEEAFYRAQPSRKNEFRGAWIHSAYGIRDWNWDKTIHVLRENGFNAVFANLLWAGRSYYPSRVHAAEGAGRSEQRDLLAECVSACQRHDVALHVWKVNWNLARAPSNFVARMRAEGRTQVSKTGLALDWLCPSHPLNFVFERDSLLEVVRQYKVAGIHFDYIRYPNSSACYCPGCRQRFEAWTGLTVKHYPADVLTGPRAARFKQWRRNQISRLVYAVSTAARKIRRKIQISAAVYGDWQDCRHTVGQDWKAWVDMGWLDFVCPMDYEPDDKVFTSLVQHQVKWVNGKVPLYIGIGAYRMASPADLIPQIQLTRKLGADGFVLFQHDARLANKFLPALRWGVTAAPPAD